MAAGTKDLVQLAQLRAAFADGTARKTREALGLRQTEVARAAGVAPASISRWEAGTRVPQGAGALRYARLLDALQRQLESAS